MVENNIIDPMKHNESYVVELEENISTGELMVGVPEAILNSMGWYEGTQLEWVLENDELLLKEVD